VQNVNPLWLVHWPYST